MKRVILILTILMIGCLTFGCKNNGVTKADNTEDYTNKANNGINNISNTASTSSTPTSSIFNNEAKEDKDLKVLNSIPEGYAYIVASNNYESIDNPTGTLFLYHKNWESLLTLDHILYEGKLGLIPSDSTIIIQKALPQENGASILKYGLYSIKEQECIVPMTYDFMSILDDEKGYYIGTDLETYSIFDTNGNILKKGKSGQLVDVIKQGDYYWEFENLDSSMNINSDIIRIYDSNFKLVREVERFYNDHQILNYDGTIYFSKSKFMKHLGYEDNPQDIFNLVSCSIDQELAVISYRGTLMVLDQNYNIIAEKPDNGEGKNTYYTYSDIYADIIWDSDTNSYSSTFYDIYGKVIKDKNGNPYTNILHDYYWSNEYEQVLYNYTNGVLNILTYKSGMEYHINIDDWQDFSVGTIFGDQVILWKDGKNPETRIYKGNRLLYDLEGIYSVENYQAKFTDRIMLVRYGNEKNGHYYLVIDKQGNKLYESPIDEEIFQIDNNLILVTRDKTWAVIDYNGDYIIRQNSTDN